MSVMVDIRVGSDIREIFESFRQKKIKDKEACGLLIGTHSVDGKVLEIKRITKPGRRDIRKRYSYKIKSKHHTEELKRAFEESGSEEVYLGTWHSHPEAVPTPSGIDMKDWKKQYRDNSHLFDTMIFVIIGTKKIKWWIVSNNKVKNGGEI